MQTTKMLDEILHRELVNKLEAIYFSSPQSSRCSWVKTSMNAYESLVKFIARVAIGIGKKKKVKRCPAAAHGHLLLLSVSSDGS